MATAAFLDKYFECEDCMYVLRVRVVKVLEFFSLFLTFFSRCGFHAFGSPEVCQQTQGSGAGKER